MDYNLHWHAAWRKGRADIVKMLACVALGSLCATSALVAQTANPPPPNYPPPGYTMPGYAPVGYPAYGYPQGYAPVQAPIVYPAGYAPAAYPAVAQAPNYAAPANGGAMNLQGVPSFVLPAPSAPPAAAVPTAPVGHGNILPVSNSTAPTVENAPPQLQAKVANFIGDIQEAEVRLELLTQKSKLIRTRTPVVRVSISDPGIVETVQFGPTEFELIGRTPGETTLTLWFAGQPINGFQPSLRYLIKVIRDDNNDIARTEYGILQKRINELFPDSYVQLIPVLDKLVVRGQARDAREAAQIMSIIRGWGTDQTGQWLGPGSYAGMGMWGGLTNQGMAGRIPGANDLASVSVISLLEVPGVQQVLLKVRVAELTRTALRQIGANFTATAGDFSFSSLLNVQGGSLVLSGTDVQFTLSALSSNGMSKILAEPNLVTLSGFPAMFIAGGQFAVPTVVGLNGAQAATTTFQGFGTMVQFTPTVIDKDHIRLQVAPTFSTLNQGNSVNGIPGMNVRSVSTSVDLREGQWLALAGLLQDQQSGSKARIPWLGDIPYLGVFFAKTTAQRDETELIILVSPELVQPMEPDQAPLILPGMEVTDPDDAAFFWRGQYEGDPNVNHRSTIWPLFHFRNADARHRAIRQAKQQSKFMHHERYYMNGPCGFSN
jgi:pilus assembly protein CpaC